jgi:NAD(P)-dependent dehydrogenase (short-subunit alcohol dehydrogenase family)
MESSSIRLASVARGRYDVSGRTVFVTGAARGIGAAAAERLHARGANVALVGLEPERLEELAARLGERAAFFEADVTEQDSLDAAVAGTVERFGALDVAIANAGISFTGTVAGGLPEQFERTLDVNLMGVWRTDRAVIAELRRSRGYLLNIASLSAIAHSPLMGAYTTAKSGVEALSDALRMESAPSGVSVGCAYFGFIDTDLVRASFALPTAKRLNESLPGFLVNPAPLSLAIDAIERGVEQRSARVYAPRWVGAMRLARGITQPLSEWRTMREPALAEAIASSDESGEAERHDPVLGVSADVLQERPGATQPG